MLNYGDNSKFSDAINPIADTRAGAEEMYRSISIKNFRCFDELTVEGMGRINLIAGKNNVGKTALLEALWVHSGANQPERPLRLDVLRGLSPLHPITAIDNLFWTFDNSNEIELSANGDWGSRVRSLSLSSHELNTTQIPLDTMTEEFGDPGRIMPQRQLVLSYSGESGKSSTARGWFTLRRDNPSSWNISSDRAQRTRLQIPTAVFLLSRSRTSRTEDANRFSELEVRGKQDQVLRVLQQIEPDLKRLTVISSGRLPSLYGDIGLEHLIPVQLMGEGMSRILSIALAIASCPAGIVLVDEVENGIHHSVMEKVWRAIGAFARSYDVQLFATTHSYECIGAAYRAFESDEEDELRLFRIERTQEGKYRSVKFDKERLGAAIDFSMEII